MIYFSTSSCPQHPTPYSPHPVIRERPATPFPIKTEIPPTPKRREGDQLTHEGGTDFGRHGNPSTRGRPSPAEGVGRSTRRTAVVDGAVAVVVLVVVVLERARVRVAVSIVTIVAAVLIGDEAVAVDVRGAGRVVAGVVRVRGPVVVGVPRVVGWEREALAARSKDAVLILHQVEAQTVPIEGVRADGLVDAVERREIAPLVEPAVGAGVARARLEGAEVAEEDLDGVREEEPHLAALQRLGPVPLLVVLLDRQVLGAPVVLAVAAAQAVTHEVGVGEGGREALVDVEVVTVRDDLVVRVGDVVVVEVRAVGLFGRVAVVRAGLARVAVFDGDRDGGDVAFAVLCGLLEVAAGRKGADDHEGGDGLDYTEGFLSSFLKGIHGILHHPGLPGFSNSGKETNFVEPHLGLSPRAAWT